MVLKECWSGCNVGSQMHLWFAEEQRRTFKPIVADVNAVRDAGITRDVSDENTRKRDNSLGRGMPPT